MHRFRADNSNVRRSIRFNPNVSYDRILAKLNEDFQSRWERTSTSPEIGLQGYEEMSLLGSGSFGQVILVRDKLTGNLHAVKILLKEHIVKTKQVENVLQEKKILECINFPFVVRLYFSRKDNDFLYMGLPFVRGGELFSYHRRVLKFSEKEARFYSSQILLALEYLHNVDILYRDLKPENILICENGYIKLIDFGFSKKVIGRTTTLCGTPEYLAPEVIQSKPYSTSADYWSFGILIYELVAGGSPFVQYSRDIVKMYEKICDGDYKIPPFFSAHLKNLISRLLYVDMSKRIGCDGIKDIKTHEWFNQVNWIGILNQELVAPYIPSLHGKEDLSHFVSDPTVRILVKSRTNRFANEFEHF